MHWKGWEKKQKDKMMYLYFNLKKIFEKEVVPKVCADRSAGEILLAHA